MASLLFGLPSGVLLNRPEYVSSRISSPCSTSSRSPSSSAPARQTATRRLGLCCQAAQSEQLSYRTAGVDIDAGNELVRRIQKLNPQIGGFSGFVPFGKCLEWASHEHIKLYLCKMNARCILLSKYRFLKQSSFFITLAK